MAEKFDNPNYNPEAGMKYLATHFEMFRPEVAKAMIADAKRKGVKIPPVVEAKARKAGILNAARNADTPEKRKIIELAKGRFAAIKDPGQLAKVRDDILRGISRSSAIPDDEKDALEGEVIYLHGQAVRKLGFNAVRSCNDRRVRVLKAERLVPDRLVGQSVEVVGGRGDDVFVKDPKFPRINIPILLKKGEYEVVNSILSTNAVVAKALNAVARNASGLDGLIADLDSRKYDSINWMPKVIGPGTLYPDGMKFPTGLGYDDEEKVRAAWKSGKYASVVLYKGGSKRGEIPVNADTSTISEKALNAVTDKSWDGKQLSVGDWVRQKDSGLIGRIVGKYNNYLWNVKWRDGNDTFVEGTAPNDLIFMRHDTTAINYVRSRNAVVAKAPAMNGVAGKWSDPNAKMLKEKNGWQLWEGTHGYGMCRSNGHGGVWWGKVSRAAAIKHFDKFVADPIRTPLTINAVRNA